MWARNISLAAGLAVVAVVAAAQVYKWVDDQGVTHYSTEPPPEAACNEVEIDTPPSAAEIEAAQRRLESLTESVESWKAEHTAEREALEAERAARAPEMDERARNCVRAQWNLDQLRKSMPAYYAEDGYVYCGSTGRVTSLHNLWYTGARRWIDDSERDDEIQHWVDMAELQCQGLDRKALAQQRARWHRKLLCERLRYEYERLGDERDSSSSRAREWADVIARNCPPEQ